FVGFVSGSRRLPVMAVVGALLVTALLHNGKSSMRARYWQVDGEHIQPGLADLPSFFSDWVQAGLKTSSGDESELDLTSKLVERTSLMHILCLVVARSPAPLPFLGGETYADIPGQFVPRFLWPGKPVGHISTYTLSIYYGLQRAEDTAKTTIGFGMVAEAYANFGLIGVGVLGCALGIFYKKIQTLARDSPLLSYIGLFEIVLMAWSFQTEAPLSMWLSSMFQACVAVMGIPFVLRNVLGMD
ncbi:MAG TPA: O-antigen polymerase, partial [Opitutus sp.]|nr:O-antigen polymerase [Opitutus sp.]